MKTAKSSWSSNMALSDHVWHVLAAHFCRLAPSEPPAAPSLLIAQRRSHFSLLLVLLPALLHLRRPLHTYILLLSMSLE
jgi:hypothetical protein